MADLGASVLARLKRKSKESGKSLQLLLQLFCQEEFLRRLCRSQYADYLVLKGGMFIYTLSNFASRSTADIDFLLQKQPGSIEDIQRMVDEIISVDIGIGDVIVPEPEKLTIPVQLEDFKPATILTYSLESTVAEKLEALIQRQQLTSRMKDIYDIYYLSKQFDFDGNLLQKAISQTITNRGTFYESDSLDKVLALSHDPDILIRWRQFLYRTKLPEIGLKHVFLGIEQFLRPVWTSIIQDRPYHKIWSARTSTWN